MRVGINGMGRIGRLALSAGRTTRGAITGLRSSM
jgi:glyceraldehyde-3-phosphate dehydrogenase/erythrose-4-phosphate dehydrogenase